MVWRACSRTKLAIESNRSSLKRTTVEQGRLWSAIQAALVQVRAEAAKRQARPGGLSDREVDVLRLAAKGLTTRQIADRLYISPKTADHHIQHIYGKIDVSTRAAAALWAMQHTVIQ